MPESSSATVSFSNQFDPSSVDTAAGFRYAYDFDNDGTFDVGDGSYGGSVMADSQMVSPALLAEGPGSQTVRAWIIDKNGGHTEYFTNVEITNVDPTLINIHVDDTTIDEGQTATITMTVNDPGGVRRVRGRRQLARRPRRHDSRPRFDEFQRNRRRHRLISGTPSPAS